MEDVEQMDKVAKNVLKIDKKLGYLNSKYDVLEKMADDVLFRRMKREEEFFKKVIEKTKENMK